MTKNNRILTLLLALIVGFVVMFSSVFTVVEAYHNCEEEHCQVCYQISVCKNTLKTLSDVVVTISAAIALVYSLLTCLFVFITNRQSESLVTLKVKLSN